MTREEFIAAGNAAFGHHFVTEMAERLSVSDRTVRNWVAGKYAIPDGIAADVREILASRMRNIERVIKLC